MSLDDVLEALRARKPAPFCVGGTFSVRDIAPGLRVYCKHSGGTTVEFPLTGAPDHPFQFAQKATFGIGRQEVLDESYRRAMCLKRDEFALSFHPSEYGDILKSIQRVLVPDGVDARLYRLNVYGTGGMFKEHRDTPCDDPRHVGSLVVCLPSPFTGGDLIVHSKQPDAQEPHVFSWTGKSGKGVVQWAALFPDCMHEVREVTSGHRITVTYELLRRDQSHVPDNLLLWNIDSLSAHVQYDDLQQKCWEKTKNYWGIVENKDPIALLRDRGARIEDDDYPETYVYFCVHEYSESADASGGLVGDDLLVNNILEKHFPNVFEIRGGGNWIEDTCPRPDGLTQYTWVKEGCVDMKHATDDEVVTLKAKALNRVIWTGNFETSPPCHGNGPGPSDRICRHRAVIAFGSRTEQHLCDHKFEQVTYAREEWCCETCFDYSTAQRWRCKPCLTDLCDKCYAGLQNKTRKKIRRKTRKKLRRKRTPKDTMQRKEKTL